MHDTKKIAIVDDHAMFRKGLAALINLFPGCTVLFDAGNGNDCIEKIDPNQLPDIVLMDISMPEMDGFATTAWLQKNHPSVKVLALSTMDAETAIIKMIKSGAKGYILKDADAAELKTAFDELMSQGFFYNEAITRKVMQAVTQLADKKNKTGTFITLTNREIDFLKLSCTELSYKEIAEKMFVSARTVEGYRDALCEKLQLKSRVGLAMYAVKNGIGLL